MTIYYYYTMKKLLYMTHNITKLYKYWVRYFSKEIIF